MNPSPEEATSTGYMTMEQGQTKHASEVNVETPSIVHKNASQDAVEKVRKMLRVDISELEMHFHLALLIPQVIVVPIVLNKFWNTEKNCHRYEVWALVQVVVAACMLGLYWLMRCLSKVNIETRSQLKGYCFGARLLFIVLFVLLLFLAGWFVLGNVWVLFLQNECTSGSGAYTLAFWILAASWFRLLLPVVMMIVPSFFSWLGVISHNVTDDEHHEN